MMIVPAVTNYVRHSDGCKVRGYGFAKRYDCRK
jgi:hypothetical protein